MLKKVFTSIIAGFVCATDILLIGNSGAIPWLPPALIFTLVAISLLSGLIFPVCWQIRERGDHISSKKMFELFRTFIRFGIAFGIASFGWKKVFGLQFAVPEQIAAIPMNKQSGEWLTWFYFGHSLTYGLIVAAIQVGGSFLLLFRKTWLFGAIILFPLMFNLSLINIFYQMNAGALWQAISLTTSLLFLLLIERKKFVVFFFKTDFSQSHFGKPALRNVIRFALMAVSLLYTVYLWHIK